MEKISYTKTIAATGAAMNFTDVGFIPSYVEVMNATTGISLVWTNSMTDGYGFKSLAAGTQAMVTTGGITPSSKTSGFIGFSLGTDSVNVNTNVLHIVAFR